MINKTRINLSKPLCSYLLSSTQAKTSCVPLVLQLHQGLPQQLNFERNPQSKKAGEGFLFED